MNTLFWFALTLATLIAFTNGGETIPSEFIDETFDDDDTDNFVEHTRIGTIDDLNDDVEMTGKPRVYNKPEIYRKGSQMFIWSKYFYDSVFFFCELTVNFVIQIQYWNTFDVVIVYT